MACVSVTKLINALTKCYSTNVPAVYQVSIHLNECAAIRETMLQDSVFMDFLTRHRVDVSTGVKASPLASAEEKEFARQMLKKATERSLENSKPGQTSDKYLLIKKNKK